jgi:hypothetical protein
MNVSCRHFNTTVQAAAAAAAAATQCGRASVSSRATCRCSLPTLDVAAAAASTGFFSVAVLL